MHRYVLLGAVFCAFFCSISAHAKPQLQGQKTETIRLVLTGDVNLNPALPAEHRSDFKWIWGNAIDFLLSADVLGINHESTLAGVKLNDPATIQFEDPLNYVETYGPKGVNVSFMSVANNHQYDFHISGLKTSQATMEKYGINYGGIGNSANDVRLPRVIKATTGLDVAFFTMVVDECFRWPNGSLYLDGCTCGGNAGPPPPYQCYEANSTMPGLWYHWQITDAFIAEASAVVGRYKKEHPEQLVVTFLHAGPNFLWEPYPAHEALLRNLSDAGADIVWCTSSHHIQRFEWHRSSQSSTAPVLKPIIYGLGDLLFRHTPGVDDFCPLYAIPCEQYRPELSLSYAFEISFDPQTRAPPTILPIVRALGTRHDEHQTSRVSGSGDIEWIKNVFNELSNPHGASIDYAANGEFRVSQQQV